jgi:hypothetical protein
MKLQDFENLISDLYCGNREGFISMAALKHSTGQFYSNMVNLRDTQAIKKHLYWLKSVDYSNYISLNVFKDKKRTEENVQNISGFMFDFDDGDQKKIDKLFSELGTPTWEINTTPSKNKWQFIYIFEMQTEANRINNTIHKAISKTMTEYFESDHTFDLARVFRMPFSINAKNGENVVFKNNNVKYNHNYFVDFIESKNLKYELDFSAPQKTPKEEKTPQKSSKKSNIQKGKISEDLENLYNKYLSQNGNNQSGARFSFIRALINKKYSDKKILETCDNFGFERTDTERILQKLGRNQNTPRRI